MQICGADFKTSIALGLPFDARFSILVTLDDGEWHVVAVPSAGKGIVVTDIFVAAESQQSPAIIDWGFRVAGTVSRLSSISLWYEGKHLPLVTKLYGGADEVFVARRQAGQVDIQFSVVGFEYTPEAAIRMQRWQT